MTAIEEVKMSLKAVVEDRQAVSAHVLLLDRLEREHRESLPPRLSHFLQRRSYAKALAWLQQEQI